MNNLNLLAGDISNAYLNALNHEKVHVILGPELFGEEHQGDVAMICRALYGLKSASAVWRDHFANAIVDDLGYKACRADNDVYMKAKTDKDGVEYYAYLIIYVDDILSIDVNPKKVMDLIGHHFNLKDGSVEKPKMYLGSDIRE